MSITLTAGETKRVDASLTPVYVPPQPATLWGYVTDASTGAGIRDVTVEVVGVPFAYSDANGRYEILDIPAGTYTVRFSHPDYETKEI